MLRWVLLLALVILILYRRRAESAPPREELLDPERDPMPRAGAVREMVADPVCGAFVAKQTALTTISGGQIWYFCSPDCYRRFLLENRRAAGQ